MTSYRHTIAKFVEQIRQAVVLLVIIFLIRTFGFGLYQVPTGSMETTMLIGERFFADKFTYLFVKPKRGDIISFNDPCFPYSTNAVMRLMEEYIAIPFIGNWPSNWTKRIIGMPGDEVKGVIENGRAVIYLNGVTLDEPYINKYPLIAVTKMNQAQVSAAIEREAMDLIAQRRLDPGLFTNFVAHRLGFYLDFRSYDPSVSYEQQPFHKIKPDHVLKDQEGNPLLKLPTTANTEADATYAKREGENYWNGSDEFYVKLDDHHYWLMGDNRQGSKDSRYLGPVDGRLIHGRILFRIWSIDSDESWMIIDLLKHPIEFWTRVRWSRFFQSVA